MFDKQTKMTVKDGDFANVAQKKAFMKKMIEGLVHQGLTIVSVADKLDISRRSIYNYMEEDEVFAYKIRSGNLQELQVSAMVGLREKVAEGNLTAITNLLDKSGYWDSRRDIQSNKGVARQGDLIDIDLPTDVQRVADSLIGDFEVDLEDPTEDKLKQVLRASDPMLNGSYDKQTKEDKKEV